MDMDEIEELSMALIDRVNYPRYGRVASLKWEIER
jgi:hypothetical protein